MAAVSCLTPGECTAAGFGVSRGINRAFVASETNGMWGDAQQLAGFEVGADAGSSVLSCPSAGNCALAGRYYNSGTTGDETLSFIAEEKNGVWGDAIEVTGPSNAEVAGLTTLSCPSPGNCVAGGFYQDSASHYQAFVINESDWQWGNPVEVPGTAALNDGYAKLLSLSCSSPGNCGAGGFYSDSNGEHPFVVDETSGSWGTAEPVQGSAALGTSQITAVSCASPGECSAGGYYSVGSDTYALVVNEIGGTWGTAAEMLSLSNIGTISCFSAGNCVAAGNYYGLGAVAQETAGTWAAATDLPGQPALGSSAGWAAPSLSCTTSGYCAAGGDYVSTSGVVLPYVADEAGGNWNDVRAVPGVAALNSGPAAAITSVSCSAAEYCSAGGYYVASSGLLQPFLVNETPLLATSTTAALSAGSATYGHEQTERVSVAVSAALGTPTGTVTVRSGGVVVCPAVLSSGKGSCTVPATRYGTGTQTLTASYSGAPGFAASVSPARTLTVTRASSRTGLTLSTTKVTYGHEQTERLTVTVAPQYAGTPGGKATIKTGGTVICTITLASDRGSCALTTKQLRAGKYTLIASYGADHNFTTSASGKATLTVLK